MNCYVRKLKAFLAEQSPRFAQENANSVLELLYFYYTAENPVDNAVIRCQFKELDDILTRLSIKENNAVFSLTCSLCAAHSRQAFLDGIHIGIQLFTELNDLQN